VPVPSPDFRATGDPGTIRSAAVNLAMPVPPNNSQSAPRKTGPALPPGPVRCARLHASAGSRPGPQYISRHFTRQLAHWGMALSHSFPHQPETNGVAERFFRTLKEQVIDGRIFHTAAEVRTAVATFVTCYNASWRLARLGYMSPLDYRTRHLAAATSAMAA
jgi:transposase InsO family protein